MIALTIYSRPGCHLCEDMKALVQRVTARTPGSTTLEEIDISGDPDLESRYGTDIPVLLIDGKKVAKYRIGEIELARALAARSGESEVSDP